MTVVGVPQFLAPLLGPVAGGLVLSTVSWRWIFFINLPIGVIALIRGRRILEPGELGTPERIDFLGMALLSPGFALLDLRNRRIRQRRRHSRPSSPRRSLGGLVLLGLFVVHALRIEQPLLDLRLWKNKSLAAATSVLFIFSSGLQAAVFSVQLYYQIGRGYSPLHAALPAGARSARRDDRPAVRRNAHGPPRCARRRPDRAHGHRLVDPAVHPDHTEDEPPHVVGILVRSRHGPRGDGNTDERRDVRDPRRDQIPGATTINNIAMRVGNSFGVAIGAAILQRKISDSFHGGSICDAHQALDRSSSGRRDDRSRTTSARCSGTPSCSSCWRSFRHESSRTRRSSTNAEIIASAPVQEGT